MKSETNWYNPPQLAITQMDRVTETLVPGVAGWIDTDVSATTGTDTTKIWLIVAYTTADLDVGARPHGSAFDAIAQARSCMLLSKVDASGHMDLYRNNTANTFYQFIGYLKNV